MAETKGYELPEGVERLEPNAMTTGMIADPEGRFVSVSDLPRIEEQAVERFAGRLTAALVGPDGMFDAGPYEPQRDFHEGWDWAVERLREELPTAIDQARKEGMKDGG